MQEIEHEPWWPELVVGLKESVGLKQLAERFGVTVGSISAAMVRTNTSRVATAAPGGFTAPPPALAPAVAKPRVPRAPKIVEAPAPEPARQAAPAREIAYDGEFPIPRGRVLWRADIENREIPVAFFADSVVEAANRANSFGRVLTLERLGETLGG